MKTSFKVQFHAMFIKFMQLFSASEIRVVPRLNSDLKLQKMTKKETVYMYLCWLLSQAPVLSSHFC